MVKVARTLAGAFISMQIVACALLPVLLVAAQGQKGVRVGDYFTYGKIKTWIEPTGAPLLDDWKPFENLTSINVTVIENPLPSQNDVSYTQKVMFSNGSAPKTVPGAINLYTGEGQGVLFFILAGLERGHTVYGGSVHNWTLNDTRTDPYWGGREVCYFNQTAVWNKTTTLFYQSTNLYWDKLTGALLLLRGKSGAYEPNTVPIDGGVLMELTATNRFYIEHPGGAEMLPVYAAIGAVSVIALIVVVVRASSDSSSKKKKWKRIGE